MKQLHTGAHTGDRLPHDRNKCADCCSSTMNPLVGPSLGTPSGNAGYTEGCLDGQHNLRKQDGPANSDKGISHLCLGVITKQKGTFFKTV